MTGSGKTALITGGSRGLGYHLARKLAERDYRVTIVGRNAATLEAAIKGFPGAEHRWLAMDLSDRRQIEELSRVFEEEKLDVFVNNAGSARFGPVEALDRDTLESQMGLNFIAPVRLSWAFVKTAARGSTLVNVTSIVGTVPVPGNALYCSAKAGLQALSECLWYEMQAKGVRVIDFRPVSLKTEFHQAAGGKSMAESSMGVDPEIAARDLASAIESGREFIYSYGKGATLLDWAKRLLPGKVLIELMGKRSRKAGYM
jgi:short-subunit dehydrogenase